MFVRSPGPALAFILFSLACAVCTRYSIRLSRYNSARETVFELTQSMPLSADARLQFAQALPVTTVTGWTGLLVGPIDLLLNGRAERIAARVVVAAVIPLAAAGWSVFSFGRPRFAIPKSLRYLSLEDVPEIRRGAVGG